MTERACSAFFTAMSTMCCSSMGVSLRCGISVTTDRSYFRKYSKDLLGAHRRSFAISRPLACMLSIFLAIETGNVAMEHMALSHHTGPIKCTNGLHKVTRLCPCLRGKNFWLLGDRRTGVSREYAYDSGFLPITAVFKRQYRIAGKHSQRLDGLTPQGSTSVV